MDAFEMWCWRAPYIAHPWTARRTNASVVEISRRLSNEVYAKILGFFGHISRDKMERLVVQGKVDGRGRRGRSVDFIEGLLKINIATVIRTAEKKNRWKNTVKKNYKRLEQH